ncbi:MAG: hypothetical protein ACE5D1_02040 [Fidelibacterota bacterium]
MKFNFTTDINTSASPRNVYVKYAKIDWNTDFGKVVIGLQGMNMFGVQEKTWGYRSVDKSAMDRFGFSHSADLGLGYYRSFGSNLNVSALITNGAGYKHAENDSYKKISVLAYLGESRLDKNPGWNGGISTSHEPQLIGTDSTNKVTTLGLFGGWSSEVIRVGGEFATQTHAFNGMGSESFVYLYGNMKMGKLDVLGRLDQYTVGNVSTSYMTDGIAVQPEPGFKVVPVIRYEKPDLGNSVMAYGLTFQLAY